ncbi:MAG TPA: diguanylate cyclase [Rhodocyclaceae bacterium]|nr:diguanylate cyclase [Rhodocyclaceae bacterium]
MHNQPNPPSPLALVIDDDPVQSACIIAMLERAGCIVRWVTTVQDGIEFAVQSTPQAIFLALGAWGTLGVEACRTLKNYRDPAGNIDAPDIREIPVLLVGADENYMEAALAVGVADFVRTPLYEFELRARLAAQLRASRLLARLAYSDRQLVELNRELAQLCVHDGLTGIANKRRFIEVFDAEWRRAQRESQCLTLLIIDIDRFRQFNERYGHSIGDTLLRAVARSLVQIVHRAGELVARYGGSQFAMILPRTDLGMAQLHVERIRAALAALDLSGLGEHIEADFQVDVSIGIAETVPVPQVEPQTLIQAAENALDQAKRQGRNCTVTVEA